MQDENRPPDPRRTRPPVARRGSAGAVGAGNEQFRCGVLFLSGDADNQHLAPVTRPNRIEISLIKGCRSCPRHSGRQHPPFRHRTARQQCAACGGRAAWGNPRWSSPSTQPLPPRPVWLPRSSSSRSIAEDINSCRADGDPATRPGAFSLLFCDDLSFRSRRHRLQVAQGGRSMAASEGRPDNVLLYATSNRRHLLPRDMIENERSTAINPSEAGGGKKSRCPIALGSGSGFTNVPRTNIWKWSRAMPPISASTRISKHSGPRRWSGRQRAARGRDAWPGSFIQDLAGRLGKAI